MLTEEYRQSVVPGYLVSNLGNVKSLKSARGITPYMNKDGYLRVPLRDSTLGQKQVHMSIHRMVALAFLGDPPSPDSEVDHEDQDKTNNCVSNLRWSSDHEQQRNSPSNVYVTYEGEQHILKDICSKFSSRTLYANVLSRVNRGKGTHQQVFDFSIKGLTYVG